MLNKKKKFYPPKNSKNALFIFDILYLTHKPLNSTLEKNKTKCSMSVKETAVGGL